MYDISFCVEITVKITKQ